VTALLPAQPSDVVWRQLRPRLWVGRVDDEHLGMVERGRRFSATDPAGDVHRGYRTLQAAQAALTGEIQVQRQPRPAHDVPAAPTALLIASTIGMLASVALSTMGIAVLR
jgi:hypothetical protein